jgi:hypothetical protein
VIRPAAPKDIPAIEELVFAALATVDYGRLVPSRERIRANLREAITNRQHFARVVEQDGRVVGALIAVTNDLPWAERRAASLAFWWAPGTNEGVNLFRSFIRWAMERPVIKAIGVTFDFRSLPQERLRKLSRLFGRAGMEPTPGTFIWFR